MDLMLTELEQAINWWRTRRPSTGEECALSPEVNTLASVYAVMIYDKRRSIPFAVLDQDVKQLVEAWRRTS